MTTNVLESIDVDVPVRTAYNQWTQFESFPQFMEGVERIDQLSPTKTHWVTKIAGVAARVRRRDHRAAPGRAGGLDDRRTARTSPAW